MDFKDITSFVGKVAPTLATVLGSPVAGAGIALLANAFGGSTKDTADLMNRIKTDPQAQIKLAEIESNYQLELKALSNDELKMLGEYGNQPWKREVELAKAGAPDNTQGVIAVMIVAFAFTFYSIILLLTCLLTSFKMNDALIAIVASLSSALGVVLGYYFVSSVEKRKS